PSSESALKVRLPDPAYCGKPPEGTDTDGEDVSGDSTVEHVEVIPEEENHDTQPEKDVVTPPVLPVVAPPQTEHNNAAGQYPLSVRRYIEAAPVPARDDDRVWLDAVKTKLRQALRSYGLDSEITGDRLTPNAALIKFRGTDTMT